MKVKTNTLIVVAF